jgi:hypothetical protein
MPDGSFTVRAQCQDLITDNDDGLVVAHARLLMKETTIEEEDEDEDVETGGTPEPPPPVVMNPEDAAYEAAAIDSDAILSAEEVTNEEVVKEAPAKAVIRTIYLTIGVLTVVLISLIVIFSVEGDDPITPNTLPPKPSILFPRTESLPNRTTMCEKTPSSIFDDFSPIVECYCGRKIPGIPADIIKQHAFLVRLLVSTIESNPCRIIEASYDSHFCCFAACQ